MALANHRTLPEFATLQAQDAAIKAALDAGDDAQVATLRAARPAMVDALEAAINAADPLYLGKV